jgi:hypothetical protein
MVAQVENSIILGICHAGALVKDGKAIRDEFASSLGTALIAMILAVTSLIVITDRTGTGDITGKRKILKKYIRLLISSLHNR